MSQHRGSVAKPGRAAPRATAAFAVLLAVISAGTSCGAAPQNNADLIPPLAPSGDEVLIRAVPVWSIHLQLNQCLESAERILADPAYAAQHARVGDPVITLNQKWGYLLRADFTRDDVAPPMVNRILCWTDGQIIESKLSVPPLSDFAGSRRQLMVPGAVRH